MQTSERPIAAPQPPAELIRAAFREVHGARLHGFALLLTLGDTTAAARLAAEALAEGLGRTAELRHPERAAAWLRGRVLRRAGRLRRDAAGRSDQRLVALSPLGVDAPTLAALASLPRTERAALISLEIERLGRRDVETIVDREGARFERLITDARRRYTDAYVAALDAEPNKDGPLVSRLRAAADRALA